MSTIELAVPPASVHLESHPLARIQRRTIATLVATQVAGGMGLAAAVTVGGLIAADLGGDAAAGLPLAAAVAGTATAALPLAAMMRRSGRRAGLRLGWLVGAAGAAVAVAATMLSSLPLLLAGMVLFGGAEAASSAARYAAADLAPATRRGTAIGTVVFSTAITATVGPNMVGAAATGAAAIGLPALAGPFVVSAFAFVVAGIVLTAALRPDPLLVANTSPSDLGDLGPTPAAPPVATHRHAGVRLGVAAAVVANFSMLSLMTVAPLHLAGGGHHGDALGLVGLIISVHVAGMFAPAPLTGRLGDRFGHATVVSAGAVLLGSAALLGASAGPRGTMQLALALGMLGVGWNLSFVGGSALLTGAVEAHRRTRMQGLADTAMGFAGVLGAGLSGAVVAWAGLSGLGRLCAVIAVALLVAALRQRRYE
jgi:MFS family permease